MLVSCLCLSLVAMTMAAPNSWVSLEKAQPVNSVLRFKAAAEIPFEKAWGEFKAKHSKSYESDVEETKRKDIFRSNLKKIEMHNYLADKGLKSYRLGVNEYADMEPKEFVRIMNGFSMKALNKSSTHDRVTYMSPLAPLQVPDEVDWRKKGYVTEVKNQGECGSCWSFSSTGSLEGQHFRKTGKLVSLSEQNLVDCSTKWGNNGCNGGLMDNAFQYIKDNGGIDTEVSYPYHADEEKCHFKAKNTGATDAGFVDVPHGSEEKLKEALGQIGPISVAIDASHSSFQLYKSGVYDEPACSSEQLDHGVLSVGYGTFQGQDYWLIKNSWGTTWGLDGYIMMTRNKNNQCGVATQASYPLV